MNRRSFLARFIGGLAAVSMRLEMPKIITVADYCAHIQWFVNDYIIKMREEVYKHLYL